jgi:hypothetical protein
LLVNANPSIRQKAAIALSSLFLIFGLEISFVNVYTLVRRFATWAGNSDERLLIAMLLAFPVDHS